MEEEDKRYGNIMLNTLFEKQVDYSPYSLRGIIVQVENDHLKILNHDACMMRILQGSMSIEDIYLVANKSIDGTLLFATWFFVGPLCCATVGIARELTRKKPGFTVEDIYRLERFLDGVAFMDNELPRVVKTKKLRKILWRH